MSKREGTLLDKTRLHLAYPADLARRVREVWPADALPLPDELEELLAVAFHASLLRDEARPVTCRLLVCSPSDLPLDVPPPLGLLPLAFREPRPFDEHELRRLCPAAEYRRALLGVDPRGGDPYVWGLLQSGPRWLQALRGGRVPDPGLPPCLVVRVLRPGTVAVSCGSTPLASLRGGHLVEAAADPFGSGWLPPLFAVQRAAVAAQHRAEVGDGARDETSAALVGHVAQQMLKRVLATMQDAHHGGALLFLPPNCAVEEYLANLLPFADAAPRRHFEQLMLAILAELGPSSSSSPRASAWELYQEGEGAKLRELDEAISEFSALVAALADVDGAVILTKSFEILGFGAEIIGALPQVHEVRRALDVEGLVLHSEHVAGVGTRHRSAYRLCRALPTALAAVVSQDGGARIVANLRGEVTYWEYGDDDG